MVQGQETAEADQPRFSSGAISDGSERAVQHLHWFPIEKWFYENVCDALDNVFIDSSQCHIDKIDHKTNMLHMYS